MKRINDSTWSSIKAGMTATIVSALLIGATLIEQDSSPYFFTLYFTRAVPMGFTVGTLVFCIVELAKHKRNTKDNTSEENE